MTARIRRALLVLAGLTMWAGVLVVAYGVVPTLIALGVAGVVIGLGLAARAGLRVLRHASNQFDRIFAEELRPDTARPDTNGETR